MRGILTVVAALGLAAGCKAMPPPPLVPAHTGTAAAPVGATTAMLVVGIYSQFLFGGDGVGLAVRVEHQHTERTAAGVELGGGRGKEEVGITTIGKAVTEDPRRTAQERRHWLIAARGYARFSARDWIALSYGGGLSVMDTGALTLSAHGGSSVSYPNDYFVPLLSLGAAVAWPVLPGAPYGEHSKRPRTDLFPYLGAGFVVPLGSTGNRLSAELDFAVPLRSDGSVVSLSVADAHQFE